MSVDPCTSAPLILWGEDAHELARHLDELATGRGDWLAYLECRTARRRWLLDWAPRVPGEGWVDRLRLLPEEWIEPDQVVPVPEELSAAVDAALLDRSNWLSQDARCAPEVLAVVQRLWSEFEASGARHVVEDIGATVDLATVRFSRLHPEVSPRAVEEIAYRYWYLYK